MNISLKDINRYADVKGTKALYSWIGITLAYSANRIKAFAERWKRDDIYEKEPSYFSHFRHSGSDSSIFLCGKESTGRRTDMIDKNRPQYIFKYLPDHTDEEHPAIIH